MTSDTTMPFSFFFTFLSYAIYLLVPYFFASLWLFSSFRNVIFFNFQMTLDQPCRNLWYWHHSVSLSDTCPMMWGRRSSSTPLTSVSTISKWSSYWPDRNSETPFLRGCGVSLQRAVESRCKKLYDYSLEIITHSFFHDMNRAGVTADCLLVTENCQKVISEGFNVTVPEKWGLTLCGWSLVQDWPVSMDNRPPSHASHCASRQSRYWTGWDHQAQLNSQHTPCSNMLRLNGSWYHESAYKLFCWALLKVPSHV